MDSRKMRTMAVIIMLISVVFLSVGYAVFYANLEIGGAGKIQGSDWSIVFRNLTIQTGGTGEDDNSSILPGLTSANLSANLKKPGDKVTYKFEVANTGSVDAKISQVVIGGDYELYSDIKFSFRYDDDSDYGDTLPKENDVLEADQSRPLIATIEFDSNATSVPSEDQNFTFSIMMVYVQGEGSLTGTDPTEEGEPDEDLALAQDASELIWLYPAYTESRGYTKTNAAEPNSFLLTSSGIDYVFNGVTMPSMTGKNILISFDMHTTGVTSRGSGALIKLRTAKGSDVADAQSKDYYGILYDGTIFRIIKSTSGSLDSVSNEISINETSLGASYNILVKTFNNSIHAELRNGSNQLVAQLDYISEDFNSSAYINNGIAYNKNIKIANVKATQLSDYVNIIAFGDSNTYGDSLTPGLRIEESWPGQINNLSRTSGIIALNKGVTYHTSGNLVSRINNDVYANKITGARNIVIIYIGTNDFNQLYNGYAAAFNNLKNNIETMRSGAVSKGFEVWLVTFPVCNDDNGPGQGRNPGLRAYNDWIVNDYYGSQHKVPVIIDYAAVQQDPNNIDKLLPEYVASDKLHSSAYGNNWLAKQVRKKL